MNITINKFTSKYVNDTHYKNMIDVCNNIEQNHIESGLGQAFMFLNKDKSKYSIVERVVFEITKIAGSKLDIDVLDEDIHIEYWIKNNKDRSDTYNIHIDSDERYLMQYEGLGLKHELTLLYPLIDSEVPTIITNVDYLDNQPLNRVASYIFPEKNTYIAFKGGDYYHGALLLDKDDYADDRLMVVVGLWRVVKDTNLQSLLHYKSQIDSMITEEYIDKKSDFFDNPYLSRNSNNITEIISSKLTEKRVEINTREFFDMLFSNRKLLNTCNVFPDTKELIKNASNNKIEHGISYTLTETFNTNYKGEYDFLLISVATDNNHPGLKVFLESLTRNTIPYLILGLGDEYIWTSGDMVGEGGGQKVEWLKNELSKWTQERLDKTIVLFTDSYDVFVCGDENIILNKYHDAIKYYDCESSVLFAAEKSCWPDESLSNVYPQHNSVYAYLNSGSFIGVAKNIYELISDYNINDYKDDQKYYTIKYINDKLTNKLALDTNCILFQTLQDSTYDIVLESNNIFENILFDSHPKIIHGNGDTYTKKMWYKLYSYYKENSYIYNYKGFCYMHMDKFHLNKIDKPKLDIPAFAITLKRSIQRRECLTRNLKYSGLQKIDFFYGVDYELDLHKYNVKIDRNRSLLSGEIGCFLSHHNLWTHVIENKIPRILVLEDDVYFNYNFGDWVDRILNEIPESDYDIINLHPFYPDNTLSQFSRYNEYLIRDIEAHNADSYILTYEGALKLVNTNILEGIMACDDYMNFLAKKKEINILHLLHNTISNQQDKSYSIIENTELFKNED